MGVRRAFCGGKEGLWCGVRRAFGGGKEGLRWG